MHVPLHLVEVVAVVKVVVVVVFAELSYSPLFYICPARHWLITQFACALVLT